MNKICSLCKIEKDIEEFSLADSKTGKRRSRCKECQAKYIQSYKHINGEELRNRWRKSSRKYYSGDKRRNKTLRQYGLREEDYNRMFDEQQGKCKICNSEATLVVDHCHITGVVRGLLCNKCNVGLGCFNDNPELIKVATNYLTNCEEVWWPAWAHNPQLEGSIPSLATN